MQNATPNHYLTVGQVAARYNVSTDSVWRWKRNGEACLGKVAMQVLHHPTPRIAILQKHAFAPDAEVQRDRDSLCSSRAPDGGDELLGGVEPVLPLLALGAGPGVLEGNFVEARGS